jgi:hypothetical protein
MDQKKDENDVQVRKIGSLLFNSSKSCSYRGEAGGLGKEQPQDDVLAGEPTSEEDGIRL